MRLSKYFHDSFFFLIIGLTLSGSRLVSLQNEKPSIIISKQQSSLNVKNNFWEYFNLGQKRLSSSLMWIATILESDIGHYKDKNLNSWMYLRFNTISFLEPNFYENYAFGGVYLSIVKDDLAGASEIYDKGLAIYPNDYSLLKDAGFHYYFEVGDFDKSLPIYQKLSQFKNSSPIIFSTLARLKSNLGQRDDAFNLLRERYEQIDDKNSIIAKKMYQYMYSLKAEKDLTCLNSKLSSRKDCFTTDLDGIEYFSRGDKFYAAKNWAPFRIKMKKKNGPQ